MVALTSSVTGSGLRCEVPLLKGGPFVLPIYEMAKPQVVGVLNSLQWGGEGSLYRAVALSDREYAHVTQAGLLAGALRGERSELRSALSDDAPIAERIAEYVNGVGSVFSKQGTIPDDLIAYWPLWPRDSALIGLYKNPLHALTVGTATGLRKLICGVAKVYLFRISPRRSLSVTAAIHSAGLRARYTTAGEFVVERVVPPHLISRALALDPSFHGAYVDPGMLRGVYLAFLERLAGTGDRRWQARSIVAVSHMVRRESAVLSRWAAW